LPWFEDVLNDTLHLGSTVVGQDHNLQYLAVEFVVWALFQSSVSFSVEPVGIPATGSVPVVVPVVVLNLLLFDAVFVFSI